jgi:hypothetical protein
MDVHEIISALDKVIIARIHRKANIFSAFYAAIVPIIRRIPKQLCGSSWLDLDGGLM